MTLINMLQKRIIYNIITNLEIRKTHIRKSI